MKENLPPFNLRLTLAVAVRQSLNISPYVFALLGSLENAIFGQMMKPRFLFPIKNIPQS